MGGGKKEGSGCGFSAAKWIYFAVFKWILRLCLLIISMLCAENICVFGKWRARTVGRTRYVERVRGRSGRIGGCGATGGRSGEQAVGRGTRCVRSRRARRQRTGDVRTRRTAGVGTVGRLRRVRRIRSLGLRVARLRARSAAARARPAGGGGAARKLPPLGILCVRSPEIFLQKAGFCRAGIVAVCVFPKKNTPAPRTDTLPPRAARKTLADAPRKKIRARPAGGITGAWRGKRRLKKTARP